MPTSHPSVPSEPALATAWESVRRDTLLLVELVGRDAEEAEAVTRLIGEAPPAATEVGSVLRRWLSALDWASEVLLALDVEQPGALADVSDAVEAWGRAYGQVRRTLALWGAASTALPRVGVTVACAPEGPFPSFPGCETVSYAEGTFGRALFVLGVAGALEAPGARRPAPRVVVSRGAIEEQRLFEAIFESDAAGAARESELWPLVAAAERAARAPGFWRSRSKDASLERCLLRPLRAPTGDSSRAALAGWLEAYVVEALAAYRGGLPEALDELPPPELPPEELPPDDDDPVDAEVPPPPPEEPEPPAPPVQEPAAPEPEPEPEPEPPAPEPPPAPAPPPFDPIVLQEDEAIMELLRACAGEWGAAGSSPQIVALSKFVKELLAQRTTVRRDVMVARSYAEIRRASSKHGLFATAEERAFVRRMTEELLRWLGARKIASRTSGIAVDDPEHCVVEEKSCDVYFGDGGLLRLVSPALIAEDGRVVERALVRRLDGVVSAYAGEVLHVLRRLAPALADAEPGYRADAHRLATSVVESVEAASGAVRPQVVELQLATLFRLLHQAGFDRRRARPDAAIDDSPDLVAAASGLVALLEEHHDIIADAVQVGARFRPGVTEPVAFVSGGENGAAFSGAVQDVVWPPLVRRGSRSVCLRGGVVTVR